MNDCQTSYNKARNKRRFWAWFLFIMLGLGALFYFYLYPVYIKKKEFKAALKNIEEDIFVVDDKMKSKFQKVTQNKAGDISLDPLDGKPPQTTIIFLHDQYKNTKDIYEMFT
jgi:hypothetical protein